jgi:hypothetical protein
MQKVVLPERTTKEVKLPNCGATIVIYGSLLVGDLNDIDFTKKDVKNGIITVQKLIKSWNVFAGENEPEPLPITEENVNKLPADDLNFLMNQVEAFATAQKKR